MRSRTTAVAATAAIAALLVGGGWWASGGDEGDRSTRVPQVRPAAVQKVAPDTVLKRSPRPRCSHQAGRPFIPVRVSIVHVTLGATVLALPRDPDRVPGVPPLTTAGKYQFAWDAPGVKPGSGRGNVLLNAHTWPDGTAMGNRLLAHLHRGDLIGLHGSRGQKLCYRVTERLEVRPDKAPVRRVYDTVGRPQIVLIVCSGDRPAPGVWTHRMLWFARPVR